MTVERLLVTGPRLNTDPRSQTLPGKSPEMAFFAQEIVLSPWTSLLWLAMQQLLSIKGISIRSLKTLFLTASIFNTEVSQLRPHVCLVGSAIPDISLLRQLVPCSAGHARQGLVLFTYLSPIPPPPLPLPPGGVCSWRARWRLGTGRHQVTGETHRSQVNMMTWREQGSGGIRGGGRGDPVFTFCRGF